MAGSTIHGMNAVREALRGGRQVNRLYLATESRAHGWKALIELARQAGVPFDFVPQAKLNALAGTQEHQGVVASISPLAYAALEECLAQCPSRALLLVLDQVQHPKNLGLLIRTAAGAGASGVIVTARGGALLDEAVVRASAGLVLHVPIVLAKNLPQTLARLRDAGFWSYALDGQAEQDLFRTPWPERCAIVMGNETTGLRPAVRKACDTALRIPLAEGVDSLNVAVAAGIALFQVRSAWGREA